MLKYWIILVIFLPLNLAGGAKIKVIDLEGSPPTDVTIYFVERGRTC